MKIGFIQSNPVFGQVNANLDKIKKLIVKHKAALLVLPELCTTGYNFISKKEVQQLAEPVNGPSINALKQISLKTGTALVAGFAEKAGKKIFNSAALIKPTGQVEIYRKTHLFGNEMKYFTPGDTGFKVFSIGRVKIGMMICFDWLFPESARILALQGAQIICHPANLVLPYCPDSMPVRALENRIYTITANRIGWENRGKDDLRFIGQSVIASPNAQILSKAPKEKEVVRIVEIDPAEAYNKNITSLNNIFNDRRPSMYKRIGKK
jgi:predicted amidohydrolase